MPTLSILFIRTAFIYFLTGISLGTLLLVNKAYPFDYRIWQLLPVHFHILFQGWILQLVFGVSFWIMPKFFGNNYGRSQIAWLSYLFLNCGLILLIGLHIARILALPVNSYFIWPGILIYMGILSYVVYAWSRVKPVIADLSNISGT
jgi:hypothetical protein